MMENLINKLICVIILVLLTACYYKNKPQISCKDSVKSTLDRIVVTAKSKNYNDLNYFLKPNAKMQLLYITDSLRNLQYINSIQVIIENEEYEISKFSDSVEIVSLGKKNEITGTELGYILMDFDVKLDRYQVSEFRFGK